MQSEKINKLAKAALSSAILLLVVRVFSE